MSRSMLTFYLLILFVSSVNARDYQWNDDKGIVIYQYCQLNDCSTTRLKATMEISKYVMGGSQRKMASLMLAQNQRKVATNTDRVIAEGKPWENWVAECFESPVDLIGSEKANSVATISPRPLTTEEQNNVSRMLNVMEGSWQGHIDEDICFGTDKAPRIEKRRYKVDAKAKLSIDDILTMKSEILSINAGTVHTQFNSLLLMKNWLHFSDIFTSDLDTSQWDVEIISVDTDSFVFMRKFRRPGRSNSSLQHLELRAFQVSKKSILIKEWFYVQGTFARMRTWTLK